MKEASFELELQSVFLTEAEEMLEGTESAFIAVEADPTNAANVDRIFRLIHTIKGSAHVAGFPALGQFAHVFETLLDALRKRTLPVTPDVVDVLLAGNDCLKTFVAALRQDPGATIDTAGVVARIDALAANRERTAPPVALTPPAAASPLTPPAAASPLAAPQAPIVAPPAPWAPASASDGPSNGRSILICDDEPAIVKLMQGILSAARFKVHTADGARRALSILAAETIDVVVTDLKMPEMNGIDFIRAVRAVNQIVPVIFVSGHVEKRSAVEILRLGASDVIEKPFEPITLVFAVQRAAAVKIMRDAVLSLSRQSFRAFVALKRLEAHAVLGGTDGERAADKQRLDESMEAIQMLTMQILASERLTKS